MEKKIGWTLFLLCFSFVLRAQDTVFWIKELPEVSIEHRPLSDEEIRNYERLVYNVRRTYPYARMASERLQRYQDTLSTMRRREQRKYIKKAEQEIRQEFLEDLKNMTTSQGKVLFKLISRQTGQSSYALVKELKSGWSAFGFQVLGSFFGYNLKQSYEPEGQDWLLEYVVQRVESGELKEIPPKKKEKTIKRSVYFQTPPKEKNK